MLDVKQLDEELLSGYLEQLDKSIIAKMLDLYMQQSKIYLEEISDAVEVDSQEQWQDRCHKMKGAAGSIGLKQLHAKLVMAEKFSEAQNQKRQLLTDILALNDTAIAAFKSWLEQL